MDRVLFVVRSFSRTGAQPIRFRQIVSYLSSVFEIHVLELTHGQGGVRHESGITIHSIEYSLPGRLFNRADIPAATLSGNAGASGKLKPALMRLARNLLFPDSVITEALRLRSETVKLTASLECDLVVLSAFPFTVLLCAGSLRRKTDARIILDVGDPFYRNSKNGFVRDLMARAFEKRHLKHIDRLIVTNGITRDHYLDTYKFLKPEMVGIVSHGVSESYISAVRSNRGDQPQVRHKGHFNLVYAGQLYRGMREPFELYHAIGLLNEANTDGAVRLDMYGSFNREFLNCGSAAPHIFFKGLIAHQDLINVYLDSDAVVFIDNACGMQLPGKVFEIALINRPVLCIADRPLSPALEVLRGYGHIVITENKSDMIVRAILKIKNTKFSFHPSENSPGFSWESRSRQYKQILDEVIHG